MDMGGDIECLNQDAQDEIAGGESKRENAVCHELQDDQQGNQRVAPDFERDCPERAIDFGDGMIREDAWQSEMHPADHIEKENTELPAEEITVQRDRGEKRADDEGADQRVNR